ncbi:HAD-like hydrolase family protein [Chondrus crispus]|uniref:HAD-like hydrolase family protein n=1 Tax=Chondrus crispus TaxID=2769 RepID=R7QL62_CHOCR|nr:HAD-like hydrolase family protein [Chondrus crispus]CDF39262.1 HAD-like hydrolase family protein [Chondrus crispus]|eukprot:XP_005719173.1 HAD-like hydrolase family protein [Chondrus crispus]
MSIASSKALIFDCDGVIVESEELHRLTYNQTWKSEGLDFEWDYALYGVMQNSIGGGREKMRWYFDQNGWPDGSPVDSPQLATPREELLNHLVKRKYEHYRDAVINGEALLRPGIHRLVDEAHARGVRLAICSAANKNSCEIVLDNLMGKERLKKFEFVLAGDVVKRKKPDPMIYNLALEKLGVRVGDCVIIEDSEIGLQAGIQAGMKVVVTHTPYTADQDFKGAAAVFPSLGEKEGDTFVDVDLLFPDLVGVPASV